uniref:Uncharacterized protein n=1 Tax=Rhizophora mucronata TaxID=61149 RepID=A0A2P2PJS4_RHIMU
MMCDLSGCVYMGCMPAYKKGHPSI